ncbi:hypothetical protein RvY_08588 [Ramazzottius varieornatus]|uniref:Cullin family profile domain-containing protein n=1 Tax=Ramazzottius varieornatus TaxID=947166 RepID=A0A1D1V6E0_RAMVA|nr:hypothetical protein RvY_08588 [Ramazzottius varieornatus]
MENERAMEDLCLPWGDILREYNEAPLLDFARSRFTKIFSTDWSGCSFHEMYTCCYYLTIHKGGWKLVATYKDVINKQFELIRQNVLDKLDETSLHRLTTAFLDFRKSVDLCSDWLMYVDRVFVPQERIPTCRQQALTMFHDLFFGFDPNGDKLKALVASWIYRDREMDEGGYFDRSTLKGLCDMFVELADGRKTYYENIIEKPFFEASHAFIQGIAAEIFTSSNVMTYAVAADRLFTKEIERIQGVFEPEVVTRYREYLMEEIIKKPLTYLLDKNGHVHQLINENRHDELSNLYILLEHLPDGRQIFFQQIAVELSAEFTSKMGLETTTLVTDLLQLKKRCDNFAQFSFDKDPAFDALVHASIGRTVASHQCNIQELLLHSIDDQLLRSTKPVDPADINRIGDLLSFLPDRASFETACKRLLARRLLTGRAFNRNLDAFNILHKRMEKNRKSAACYGGANTLLELVRMVDDVETSKKLTSHFHSIETGSEIDCSVLMLRSGLWPISLQNSYSLNLPYELAPIFEDYSRFYNLRHKGRKVALHPQFGSVTLTARFDVDTECVVQLSLTQTCILLLFNDRTRRTLDELHVITSIPVRILQSTLHDLSFGKHKILVVDSVGIQLNTHFIPPSSRIQIPPTWVHDIEEVVAITANHSWEAGGRRQIVDASIVRVMKVNKEMDGASLNEAVKKDLGRRMQLDVFDDELHDRINSLILREYLTKERIDNVFLYRYKY